MIRARISTWSLYQYDDELFAGLKVPVGLDREVLINKILLDAGHLGCIYPDPEFLRSAINIWSTARLESWAKMYEALNKEYDPLWNKDAWFTEEWTDSRTYGKKTTASGKDTTDVVETPRVGRVTETSPADVTTDSVKGYNSTSWLDNEKTTRSGKITEEQKTPTGTDTTKTEFTAGVSHQDSGTDSNTRESTRREYGNIGVTTSQQMLQAEMELRSRFNMYEIITQEYKERFCLMVY